MVLYTVEIAYDVLIVCCNQKILNFGITHCIRNLLRTLSLNMFRKNEYILFRFNTILEKWSLAYEIACKFINCLHI